MNWRIPLKAGDHRYEYFNFPEIFSGIQWWCAAGSKMAGAMATMLCISLQAKCAIEIGIANGFSTQCLARGLAAVGREGLLISCDEVELSVNISSNMVFGLDVRHKTIHGNSLEVNWGDHLEGIPCQLAFVDGDHTYEGCIKDFRNVEPVMAPNGIILAHDYHGGHPGVIQACNEMASDGWKVTAFPEMHDYIDYGWAMLQR